MDKIDKKKKLKKKLKQKQKQKQTVKTNVKVNVQSSGGSGGGGFAPAGPSTAPASIPATFRDTAGENIRLASLVEQAVGRAARRVSPTYDTTLNPSNDAATVSSIYQGESDLSKPLTNTGPVGDFYTKEQLDEMKQKEFLAGRQETLEAFQKTKPAGGGKGGRK